MKLTGLLAVAFFVTGIFTTAHAASTSIGGDTMSCPAAKEIASDDHAPTFGVADPAGRIIILNRRLLQPQRRFFRRFVFLHECGHMHVGLSETGADCWAIKRAKQQGWLKPHHLRLICKRSGGGDRCQSLQSCYRTAGNAARTISSASVSERRAAERSATDLRRLRGNGRSAQLNMKVKPTLKHDLKELADARRVSMHDMLERILYEWQQAKLPGAETPEQQRAR